MNAFTQQTWYELLEVAPSASRAEILDAYARAMETYSPDSIAVYTLVDPGQIDALRQRLTQARDVLVEVEQRLTYDAQIGVKRSAEEQARLRAEVQPAPAAPPPEVKAEEPAAPPPEVKAEEPVAPGPAEADVVATAASEVKGTPSVEESTAAPAPPEVQPPETSSAPMAPAASSPGGARASAHARPGAPVARRSVGVVASPSRPGLRPLPTPGTRPALHPSVSAQAPEVPSAQASASSSSVATAPAPASVAPVAPVPTPAAIPAPIAASASSPPVSASTALTLAAASATPPPGGPEAPAANPAQARDSRSRPKVFFEIPPDAEFNGELLRRVRESRGLTLQSLAERTRISSKHMDNIEADRYEALPATVYLRGMLMSVARELGLDPLRVCRSYMGLVASAEKKRR